MVKRKTTLSATAVAASALLLAGCNGGGGPTVSAPSTNAPSATSQTSSASPSESSSSSSPTSSSPTSTATPTTEEAGYKAGQCLNERPDWEVVPCSEGHYFEVSAVVKSSKYSGDLVKRSAYRNSVCDARTAKYLDGAAYGSLLLGEPLPVAADPKNDERIVCIVAEHKGDDSGIKARTGSLKGAFTDGGFYDYQMCLSNKASGDTVKISPPRSRTCPRRSTGSSWGTSVTRTRATTRSTRPR